MIAGSALADTTYTATQTIPVPPQSTFHGASGGGDGWAVALSNTQLFNVFHHSGALGVECHNQSDGSQCWPDDPTFITDGTSGFATSGQPGLYLDQAQGKLYVYATRVNDLTGGVVCVDVSNPTADPSFCGFTTLTGVGESPFDWSSLSSPMKVGSKLYSFNYVAGAGAGAGVGGTENMLLCFDLTTDAACAGQPFAVNLGLSGGALMSTGLPSPMTVAIGSKLFMPLADNAGNQRIACWDAATGTACAGSWPITLGFGFAGSYGGPFAMLDSTGSIIGLCLPTGSAQCYNLDGSPATTPTNLPSAISSGGSSVSWDGGGVIIGPRVYIPEWSTAVACFDYSTGASCAGFPKQFSGLDLLYSVNPDPQRPTCLWINSDDGSDQIQNFDAFSGGACGQGAIRVLASQFVVPSSQCVPASYQSLQITDPAASTYDTSGSPNGSSITFEDGDGNPIPGVGTQYLDSNGSVSLAGLNLNGPLGLPQFLISLVNPSSEAQTVTVKLTWNDTYNPACAPSGGGITQTPTSTSTSLSGGGQSGATINVAANTAVTDQATLSGTDTGAAGGTVTYTTYSDSHCTQQVAAASTVSVTNGSVPASGAVTLSSPGTYYWLASYSGDPGNQASSSGCGSETATVPAPVVTPVVTPVTVVTASKPVAHCPVPVGAIGGMTLGVFQLGMTQGQARTTLYWWNVTRNKFDNFCLYKGWGIRLGYPTAGLLKKVGASGSQYSGHVVLALTANPFYALGAARPGVEVSTVAKALHLGKPFHVGANDWYFVHDGASTGVLKVRKGVIHEVGLASLGLTKTRKQQRMFINSFDQF